YLSRDQPLTCTRRYMPTRGIPHNILHHQVYTKQLTTSKTQPHRQVNPEFRKQLRPREKNQAPKVDSSHERGLSRQHFTNFPSLPHPPLPYRCCEIVSRGQTLILAIIPID